MPSHRNHSPNIIFKDNRYQKNAKGYIKQYIKESYPPREATFSKQIPRRTAIKKTQETISNSILKEITLHNNHFLKTQPQETQYQIKYNGL